MPTPRTHVRVLEAAEPSQASPDTATGVARQGAEEARNLVEQAARAVQAVVQQAGRNLDLALQLAGTAASGCQAVQAELAGQARQAARRTQDALSQAAQVRSPTALLDLQGSYLADSLRAALDTNARFAEIAADVARQAAGKLPPRAA